MKRIDELINVEDFERTSRRRLPRPIFDSIAGGAGAEQTIRWNRRGFDQWHLVPRALVDARSRDLSTTVLGEDIAFPVLLGPTGFQRLVNREAELATARAAGAAGTAYVLSTATSYQLEDVAAESEGPKWFQLYMPKERSEAEALVLRAKNAGFRVLCITIDTPMHGIRERDIRNRLTVPLKLRPKMVAAGAVRPRWAIDFLRGGVGRGLRPAKRLPMSIKEAGMVIARLGRTVTYEDLEWLRAAWDGPLVVKGVLRAGDCQKLLDYGVNGIVVSNHGGRQLDSAPATIDVLPGIVEAVGGRADVFMDGGLRRGTDVVKALALGAKAVLIGRPCLWGLAVGGQAGVERVLDIFRQEIDTVVGLLGCPSIGHIDRTFVAPVCTHSAETSTCQDSSSPSGLDTDAMGMPAMSDGR